MKHALFLILLLLVFISFSAEPCDMVALMAPNPHSLSYLMTDAPDTLILHQDIYGDFDLDFYSPYDYFVFLGRRSSYFANNDGYGFTFCSRGVNSIQQPEIQLFYQIDFSSYYKELEGFDNSSDQNPFHRAYNTIKSPSDVATIMLGHVRNTSVPNTPGNHPFHFEYATSNDGKKINKIFTFQHNGDCSPLKQNFIDYLMAKDRGWFKKHPLNWNHLYYDPNEIYAEEIIDSELLFHFIMAHIMERDADIIGGITSALNHPDFTGAFRGDYPPNRINFILSDGDELYVFRNTPAYGSYYNLEYKVHDDGFIAVKTQDDETHTDLKQFSLTHIFNDGDITTVTENIFDEVQAPTPQCVVLHQNFPNPFNPKTVINYDLPQRDHVSINVYDITGKLVKNLMDSTLNTGSFATEWIGDNEAGQRVESGLYFYKITTRKFSQVKMMMVLR